MKRLAAEQTLRHDRTRLFRYRPYPKQAMFHAAGREHDERLLMAANQVGKTTCGAAECALHLTGLYAEWEAATGLTWEGRRWDRPVRGWAGSETFETTRDGVQRLLLGDPRIPDRWGTGMIPAACLVGVSRHPGVPDAVAAMMVRHVSGGISTLGTRSFDQGRRKWAGETLDFVWFDEEPPEDVYIEGRTRTNATGGMVWLTFTPLLGMTAVVRSFQGAAGDPF